MNPTYTFPFKFVSGKLRWIGIHRVYNTGVVEDPRSEKEKRKSYLHEERLLSTATIEDVFGNLRISVSKFYYENQWYVGSCVAHGVGLALAIERLLDGKEYARLAWLFAYRLRANFPQSGAWLDNIFNVYAKLGAPLFNILPTKVNMEEMEATNITLTQQMYTEAEIFKGKEFYALQAPNDIYEIAKIAQAGHGVPILIYATEQEWAREVPIILDPNLDPYKAAIRHCVCVLPKSGHQSMADGKNYITIQDSAWFGGLKLRHLSEDFIKARVFGAGYWDTVSIIGNGVRPKYTFTKLLRYGSRGTEVKKLQELLISEGLLPNDCATGYFGGRTLAGLHAFQNKYASDILMPLNLDAPTDVFGSKSITVANKLCQ